MNSRLLPAEHLFALGLHLLIIAISAVSLARLFPLFLHLNAKDKLLNAQLQKTHAQVQNLELNLNHDRIHPHLNLKQNANLAIDNQLHIIWKD